MLNKKPKIIISVINDLVTDNRVHKVSQSLHNNGYEVLLIGRLLKESLSISKRDYTTRRMILLFHKGSLFYAEINIRLFLFLLFTKFDIALSNDLDTLPANYFATKLKRKKLVYDSHEIFTEVPELVNRPFQKMIWSNIEKFILPKLNHYYTVNKLVADFYFTKYKIRMQVIRNISVKKNAVKKFDANSFEKKAKTILYQGALNVGRGIELMIKAMQYIENAEFVIIGDGDIKNQLLNLVRDLKLTDKVKLLGKIPLQDIFPYTSQADLGISLEENLGLNYYYSLPNKIFDYIHAGVPVLISDFPEMKNLVLKYKVGIIAKSRDEQQLASQILDFFEDNSAYQSCLENINVARYELNWENEEKILLNLFNSLNE